jgi:geranylgeranyl reductase family protein
LRKTENVPMHIAIVGAGPAGAMAAVRLARAGATVSLFDPTHPREKPCGGGLTGRALELVSDVVDIATLPAIVVQSANVEPPEGTRRAATVALDDRGSRSGSSLVVFSRAIFDRALVDAAVHAGAALIPEKVIDVCASPRGSGSIVRSASRDHHADFVLGADGANSLVRRKFAKPFSREQLSVAAGYFVHGATSTAIDIKSMVEQPGYLWSFPRPDHLAVGVCAPAAARCSARDLRRQSLAWIRSHELHRHAHLEQYAWPIPSVAARASEGERSAGPGWMLLGDAAGLVDPLTREGIYYALLSGQWAADALISRSSSDAPRIYQERLDAGVRPELARAAKLSGMFFTRAFSSLLVEALDHSSGVRRVFADLVGGRQPYRGLRRRLLGTREWRLAGRAIRIGVAPRFTSTMKGEISPRHSSTA